MAFPSSAAELPPSGGMKQRSMDDDFSSWSWHDNALYGSRLDVGDPTHHDWHADLVLDIDHIVEWICSTGGGARFRVAPATLTFHDVTDLRVIIDCGDSGCQTAVSELSIDRITRQRVRDQKVCFDRPYHRWRIALNPPSGGELTFGASGFSQALRAEPLLLDHQKLPLADRA
jgi:hypothetical protein